jgi:uncharacterized protein YeaO (DUF488 family)
MIGIKYNLMDQMQIVVKHHLGRKIYRKSINEILENKKPINEYYILVTREYPMQFRFRKMKLKDSPIDAWDRELAPSRNLLKRNKSNRDWESYKKGFSEEISLEKIDQRLQIHLKESKDKDLVIICEEGIDKYPFCHTWLILDMIKNL